MTGSVRSVNVAVVRDDLATRAPGGRTGIDKRPVEGPVLLTAAGVAGDTVCDTTYHGGPDQAVYAYAAEDLEFWAAELGRRCSRAAWGRISR
jgi:MOSC domain-containing protein YiiM